MITLMEEFGNAAAFNGNISAIKWSKDQSLSGKKENAYTYGYDPLNRIASATFKEKYGSWALASNSAFSESGYKYDLNGNIQSLLRYDKRGSSAALDNLVYNYGSVTSNKLMKVTDNGDDFRGFVDGTNSGNDYTYDRNGNMLTDQNKGITKAIEYNHLNLPQSVSKGGNNISYLYDATGRKLSQITTFTGSQKQVDYSGEYQYENDVIQFINHEEGRIVFASTENVFTDDASAINNFTAVNASVSTVAQNGTEKYLKAIITGASDRPGVFPIGGTIQVAGGERYKIRVRGYHTKGIAPAANPAYLLVKANDVDLTWNEAVLPEGLATANTESWTEQIITIPAGATRLEAGIGYDNEHVLNGEIIYINDFEITKLTTNATPEYQFNLKDHLGNVRVTFTTKSQVEDQVASLEDSVEQVERSRFLRYDNARRIYSTLLDHTHHATAAPEVVYTNQFDSNTSPFSSWALTIILDNGRMKAIAPSQNSFLYSPQSTVVGRRYRVSYDIGLIGGAPIEASIWDTGTNRIIVQTSASSDGTHYYEFTAQSSTSIIIFRNPYNGFHEFYLDNIMVSDLNGNSTAMVSQRLDGSENEKYGLAKSLSVMPGDTINMEVWAKYLDPDRSHWTTALNNLFMQIANNTAGVVIDGAAYSSSTASFPWTGTLSTGGSAAGPKAFLNYIMFDRDMVPILTDLSQSNFVRMSDVAKETGNNVDHELLSATVIAKQAGYMYIYLSNDESATTPVEVYFDDFKVTQIKSPVIQQDDYYPFGLRYNSYSRENSISNNTKLFQGQEHIDDLGLNWDSFKWRNHQPDIGRFFNIDPLSEKYLYNSPYAFSENKVIGHIELEGLEAESIKKTFIPNALDVASETKIHRTDNSIQVSSQTGNGEVVNATIITLPSSDNQSNISDQSATVLGSIAMEANESGIAVTSMARTPEDQARVMYDKTANEGATSMKALYGAAGDAVIDVYTNKTSQGYCDLCTKSAMESKINEVGPTNVSNHTADPAVLQVFDVAPSSVSNANSFQKAINSNTGAGKSISNRILPGGSEKAYHIEIKQKQ